MKVYVSPVSGGFFPNQLGTMMMFPEPDLFLGASGGNLANYMYCAIKSKEVLQDLSSFIPSLSINKNSFYFLEQVVYSSGPTEKITLVHNKDTNRAELYSNKSHSDSLLQNFYQNDETILLYSLNDIHYNSMNVKKITKTIIASYSIPEITSSTVIGDSHFDDGGVCYASPLTPLKYNLRELKVDQLIYFSPFNSNKLKETILNHPDLEKELTRVSYSIMSDRSNGLDVLVGMKNIKYVKCSIPVFHEKYSNKRCFVIVQPLFNEFLNIFKFNGDDVTRIMKLAQDHCECHVWYSDDVYPQ